MKIVELVQQGTFLEGISDGAAREIQTTCFGMGTTVTDTALSLGLFENAMALSAGQRFDHAKWDRDREAERLREEKLAAEQPLMADDDYMEWRMRLSEQARRDVLHAKWREGELPEAYTFRLPFLYARMFVLSLAQLGRALSVLAKLDCGTAKPQIAAARDSFYARLPSLKPVRDSIEHSEDRMRGRNKQGDPLTLGPISNGMIDAPGGGVLVADVLNNNRLGWTVEDGTYAEIEVSGDSLEVARDVVQQVYDALPWREMGMALWTPSR